MGTKIFFALLYFAATFYFGYLGWKRTKDAPDFMLAGRKMNPFVMGMSYVATAVSTAAIVGFGGAASLYGMPLNWVVFVAIFFGIFCATVFLGKRARRIGLTFDSHTLPDILGSRYQSKFVQGFSGGFIFLFMPIYAGAVLVGMSRMLEVYFYIPYALALALTSAIIAIYVITGGLKAVMYTDTFQGVLMVVMLFILALWTYSQLGGFINANQTLTDMVQYYPANLKKAGMLGWTQGAEFGSPVWMVLYTTLIPLVGIGFLAQPQLVIRFMSVKSDRQLNRSLIYSGVAYLIVTIIPFSVGALSNAIFFKKFGKISIQMAEGNIDKVIPILIETCMPGWFGILFLLGLFAAAMSTLSSQYHAGGTGLGRDFYGKAIGGERWSEVSMTKIGIALSILLALLVSAVLPGSIVAFATAFFFGLCASSLLPMFILGLYWKGMTRAGAIASMVGGFSLSFFYLLFVHGTEARGLGLCKALFGVDTLVSGFAPMSFMWKLQFVDQNLVALPISFLLAWLVSLYTKPFDNKHLELCWKNY